MQWEVGGVRIVRSVRADVVSENLVRIKEVLFQPSFRVSGPVMHDCTDHPRDSESSSLCVTPVLSAKDPVHRPSTLLQPLEFCSAHCLDSVPFALKTMFSNFLR